MESSRRDLHNALLCTALKSHFFQKFARSLPKFAKFFRNVAGILQNFANFLQIFDKKNEITELCKGVHCVDLGESFQTHIYLQNFASIQPRTSPLKTRGARALRDPLVLERGDRGPPSALRFSLAGAQRYADAANFRGLVLGCIEAKFCK